MKTTKLWGGRFTGELDALMKQFQDSISFDIRLWEVDIQGSMAYAEALAGSGIITKKESAQLIKGLRAVRAEFAAGAFQVGPNDEDIHTAVERRLKEIVGPVAGKLHTGRSRNDQVALDMRLWSMRAIGDVQAALVGVQEALLAQVKASGHVVMPGYTHLQRAQPITFGHWAMAYFWQLSRDVERLGDARKRAAVSPLGSGALAGNPFGVDRAAISKQLGMDGAITQNSLDGVSDRDFVAEILFCCALAGVHISRLAEDVVLYSTAEFGFVTCADAYSTGSSLMPQKKNPDAMELARGKSGRLVGHLMGFLTLLKGLPMTYNKDLQEDKEGLFDSVDTLVLTSQVVAGAMRTLTVHPEAMRGALSPAMLATDVAEYLVRAGLPFREAHHLSGAAVALAEKRGVPMNELTDAEWRGISKHFGPDICAVFNYEQSAASRDVPGGTAPKALALQLKQAGAWLKRFGAV